ncbi:MerR family transcriptional regulator [Neorhizobium lilium]|uniref:MerR family transcriptional regulator n=1 Tax=Neorhizobium lilium TaxID=2503024 RepID=A0A444LL74_9HYPH|nr:MerR family transcriptional regulator [Neorhizobium lilium]RWX81010.1 MerR family transcriptional regulator [Neorhizobium lilium]
MPEARYTLSQISELAHIPSQTIYAWERRYKALVPTRTSTGRRTYTRADLLRLKLLKACVDQGSRIGTIAGMSEASLKDLLESERERPAKQSILLHHALALEHDELDTKIGLALMSLGPAAFADQALSPLMLEIGHRWRDEPDAIAAEHIITASTKSILSTALRLSRPRAIKAAAVFATPEGELHELGLLTSALVAQNCGIKATYLGAQMPVPQLFHVVEATQAKLLVVASSIDDPEELAAQVNEMRTAVPKGARLLVGGRSSARLKREAFPGVLFFDSVSDFEEFLLADFG